MLSENPITNHASPCENSDDTNTFTTHSETQSRAVNSWSRLGRLRHRQSVSPLRSYKHSRRESSSALHCLRRTAVALQPATYDSGKCDAARHWAATWSKTVFVCSRLEAVVWSNDTMHVTHTEPKLIHLRPFTVRCVTVYITYRVPLYPGGQVHENIAMPSTHCPPF